MDKKRSPNSPSNGVTEITEDDLFLYFIQRNLWVKDDFDEFKKRMEQKGVRIIYKGEKKNET